MEQKTKFILVGLIGVSLIFGFLYFQALTGKQRIITEKNILTQENLSLNSKLSQLGNNLRGAESKISSLNKELEKASREKADLEKRYEIVNKEKDELISRLKMQQEKLLQLKEPPPAAQPAQAEAVSQTSDDYWAGILKEKTELTVQLNDIRSELKSLQAKNEELIREKMGLELQLKDIEKQRDELSRNFEYNKKLLDNISKELVVEKNYKMRLEASFKELKEENSSLTKQVKSLETRKSALEAKLQSLQEKNVALETKISELETGLITRISEFKQQLENIQSSRVSLEQPQTGTTGRESSVELPPIVVRPQERGLTQPPVRNTLFGNIPSSSGEAKVLSVNKENNFVIIDKGAKDGIRVGNSFVVEREGKGISELEVIQVRDNIAACDIKKQTTPIRVGDIVK
ncbi:MAG: hypothetical protein NC916_01020 [Candidatus Omnitrophica bacterium]|nr:hypothetical protein [Candidatus Omnitrophota bacterium]